MTIRLLVAIFALSLAITSSNGIPFFLCERPALARWLSFCKPPFYYPCEYSQWSTWKPMKLASRSEAANASCRPSENPVWLERTRKLNQGERATNVTCKKPLREKNVTCKLTTIQQVAAIQQALGVSMARPAPVNKQSPQSTAPPNVTTVTPHLQMGRSLVSLTPHHRYARMTQLPTYIAFILDSSGSVGKETFDKSVDNLAKLVSFFCYDWTGDPTKPSTNMRFALLVYSMGVRPVFNFADSKRDHTSVQKIRASILRAKNYYAGRSTATGPALRYAYNNLFPSRERPNGKRRVFLMTDGRSNYGERPGPVAEALANSNVHVFPIGIGSGINKAEIKACTQPKNSDGLLPLFLTEGYASFTNIVNAIGRHLQIENKPCQAGLTRK